MLTRTKLAPATTWRIGIRGIARIDSLQDKVFTVRLVRFGFVPSCSVEAFPDRDWAASYATRRVWK